MVARERGAPESAPAEPKDVDGLLTLIAGGDALAFAALYDELSPLVLAVVGRTTRNDVLTEDVAQEVFTWVWREAARFDPALGSARSWILTVARRRAVDCVRHESAWRRRTASSGEASVHRDPWAAVDDRAWLDSAMGAMTDLQRAAVSLAYYGEHSRLEMAGLLDAKQATVTTRVRDGLIRMRIALESDGTLGEAPLRA